MSINYEKIRFQIKNLYREILKREADEDGLQYWMNKIINDSVTLESIKKTFYASQEYEQLDQKYNFSKDKTYQPGFFDDYPQFFKTSKIVEHPNQLNGRYKAIIESNKEIICKIDERR